MSDPAPLEGTDELHAYREAIEQEYQTKVANAPDDVDALTRDFFKKNAVAAAAQIVYLSQNAESETVRGSMSKYVIEKAVEDADKDGDPIRKLLEGLQDNDDLPQNQPEQKVAVLAEIEDAP